MGIWFSKCVLLSIVLSSTLTSALVVPRDAYSGYSPPYGTGNIHSTTSSAPGYQTSSLGTSCVASATITVTVSGSSIVPPASIYSSYSITSGSTIYGYPTGPFPSSLISSSTVEYPAGPSVPPPENPATSDYPLVVPTSSVVGPPYGGNGPANAPISSHAHKSTDSSSIATHTPMPYESNRMTGSVAPYPTTSLTLQGTQVSHNTGIVGTAPTPSTPIPTGYITTQSYGTGYMPSSSVPPYPEESDAHSSHQSATSSTSAIPVHPTSSSESAIYPALPSVSAASSTIYAALPVYSTSSAASRVYPTSSAAPPVSSTSSAAAPPVYSISSAAPPAYSASAAQPMYPVSSSVSPALPTPSSTLPVASTPIVSSMTGVYVPTSSLPPVPGSMTIQTSAVEPVATDYPALPEVPASSITSSTIQSPSSLAVPTTGTSTGPVSSGYPANPIHTGSSGAMYSPSSSIVSVLPPPSAVTPGYPAAPNTMITSIIKPSAASGIYDTPIMPTGGYAGSVGIGI